MASFVKPIALTATSTILGTLPRDSAKERYWRGVIQRFEA